MKIGSSPALPLLAIATLLPGVPPSAAGADPLEAFGPSDLPRLQAMIRPQPGESPWREIDWFTDVTEARRRAAAEDKPIVIFTAADGSPLGRT